MSSVKITYDLRPAAGVDINGLNKSKAYEFPILASPEDGLKPYYTALQSSTAKARERIGSDLTAWRDAIGKAELTKEPKQLKEEGEEEEEEGEEEKGEEEQ